MGRELGFVNDNGNNDPGPTSDVSGREEDPRGSRQRFECALEHSAIGMALISPEGRWLKTNSALCELSGYREEELLAKTFQDLTYPEDLNAELELFEQMIKGAIHSYQVEKRFLRGDEQRGNSS